MNPPLAPLHESSSSRISAEIPFEQRWDILKPDIVGLFVSENRKLPEVVEIMKANHGFHAT